MSLRGSLILYAITIIVFGALALIPETWATHHHSNEQTITILAPWIPQTLVWVSVILAGILFFMAVLAYGYDTICFPVIALLLAIIGFPCSLGYHIVMNLGPWTMHGRVQTESKDTYIFCDSSFLQGQMMAVTQLEIKNLLFTHLKVFGISHGDNPRSWASIIRPAGSQDEYGQLYLTDNRILIGVRYDNRCFMTYDLDRRIFQGFEKVEALSPFICLTAVSQIHDPDIQRIRDFMNANEPGGPGFPHRETLVDGLKHPNSQVREIARQLLDLVDQRSASAETGIRANQ